MRWHAWVEGPSAHWHAQPSHGQDPRKNWELWNHDVVEAFLQLRGPRGAASPYLELQLSPLNQPLALVILKPRIACYTPMALELLHHVQVEGPVWTSTVEVELPRELGEGALHGGLFACLGGEPRSFFSLNPNPEERPDFHRPELFLPL